MKEARNCEHQIAELSASPSDRVPEQEPAPGSRRASMAIEGKTRARIDYSQKYAFLRDPRKRLAFLASHAVL